MNDAIGGRDRRREPSIAERQDLFAAADGFCQKCGSELGPDWHAAHLNAWSNGGATSLDNMAAWCKACNLGAGAVDFGDLNVAPRDWQEQALPKIVDRIYETGVATVQAAPGAGKTLFAGFVFLDLAARGLVDRMVVVVPRANLVNQWEKTLSNALRLHLDARPRDKVFEYQGTRGVIVTYQSITAAAARAHRTKIDQLRTLVVLDEVHHLGTDKSWGENMRAMVGDVDAQGGVRPAGILNLTGTLFRSQKNSRISTVRYRTVEDNKIEARADFKITADELIRKGQLRKPILYRVRAQAEVVDLSTGEVTRGAIADLNQATRRATKRDAVRDETYQRTLIEESLASLSRAQQALGGRQAEALKLLYVAPDQKSARKAADLINQITRRDFARLVVSDEKDAHETLRRLMIDNRPCAIVSCQMVTEGFDHPPVAVIAYASHFLADLYVAQMMARAMRVTKTERDQRKMLPAQILIPDDPDLVAAFENAMIAEMHILDVNDQDIVTDVPVGPGDGERTVTRRFELLDLSGIEVMGSNVLGEEDNFVSLEEETETGDLLTQLGVPRVYASPVVVAARKLRDRVRTYSQPEPGPVTTETANPRVVSDVLRQRIDEAVKWWHPHIHRHPDRWTTIAQIQTAVNKAGGIGHGGRGKATHDQLRRSYSFICRQIIDHCERWDEPKPDFARSGQEFAS
jgi:superfamily II DNA or RNA helicase